MWGPLLAVGVLAFFYFLVNFGAARSPVANTRGLPVAVVNRDVGAEIDGKHVDLGEEVLQSAITSKKVGNKVSWTHSANEEEILRGIARGRYYGALVIPRNYSESVAELAGPPRIPVAIANEDKGAMVGGKPFDFGNRVSGEATSNPHLKGVVAWSEVSSRERAIEGFAKGDYDAVIVVPKDYSGKLAALAVPSVGSPGPARVELLTNPAASPSDLGTVQQIFSGIVGAASEASAGEISGSLTRADVRYPAKAVKLVGDPVHGEVEQAHPEDGAKAPKPADIHPAQVEILSNPSAGPFASGTVQQILSEIVQSTSQATSRRLTRVLATHGVQVSPERAAVLGEPVVAKITDTQPIGKNSGRGLMPFYLVFTALILGFIGANAVNGGVDALGQSLATRFDRGPSRVTLFAAKTTLGLTLGLLLGAVETLVALGIYGIHHESGGVYVFLFLSLISLASMAMALMLLVTFGSRGGILAGSFLIISLGLATSGGSTPLTSLPDSFRTLAHILPFDDATDGVRALLFYGARLDAGLGAGLQVLLIYLAGAVLLGGLVSLARDLLSDGEKPTRMVETGPERGAAGVPSTSAETGDSGSEA